MKRNNSWGIKGYQKGICFRYWFILMQVPYQQFCYQGKGERYMVPLLLNQIGLVTQLRRTLKGEVMNHLMFQVIFWIFLCRQGNYWGITIELLGNYWVKGVLLLNPSPTRFATNFIWIMFTLCSPPISLITLPNKKENIADLMINFLSDTWYDCHILLVAFYISWNTRRGLC